MNSDDVENIVCHYKDLCDRIRAAGGISFEEVMDGATVPLGYTRHDETGFYVPPNFNPDGPTVIN